MKKLCLLFIINFSLGNCGSIVNGSWQRLKISSNAPNTEIFINETSYGIAPFSVKVKRNQEYKIVAKSENFENSEVNLVKRYSKWWSLGNLIYLVYAPIPYFVDFIYGSHITLIPKEMELPKKIKNKKNQQSEQSLKTDFKFRLNRLLIHFNLKQKLEN